MYQNYVNQINVCQNNGNEPGLQPISLIEPENCPIVDIASNCFKANGTIMETRLTKIIPKRKQNRLAFIYLSAEINCIKRETHPFLGDSL